MTAEEMTETNQQVIRGRGKRGQTNSSLKENEQLKLKASSIKQAHNDTKKGNSTVWDGTVPVSTEYICSKVQG